jgi:hypothetical protein
MSQQPKPRQEKTYTDIDREKALARLALNAGNAYKTSRDLGIPAKTITCWRDKYNKKWEEIRASKKKEVIGLAYDAAVRASAQLNLKLLDEEAIKKISARDLATITGIMTDKALILEGSILGDSDQEGSISEFLEEIKGRREDSNK